MRPRLKSFSSRSIAALLPALFACALVLIPSSFAAAQPTKFDPLAPDTKSAGLISSPTLTPGTAFLFGLEKKFAAAVAQGGGTTFASFFDKDGVSLGNRTAAAIGQAAIAKHATWLPQDYQLTWTAEAGELSPSGDMGFTWGHYKGQAKNTPATHGRYMTIWKKESDGTWKVILDSSNDDPPDAAACECKVEKP